MYKNIMLPVDLAHAGKLSKAISIGADLAKHYQATITAVAVTSSAPSEVAPTPEAFEQALNKFSEDQSSAHGVKFQAKAMVSADPTIDLDKTLAQAADELGCDLVIMASHVPGLAEYVFASQAGYFASHSSLSVLVVR